MKTTLAILTRSIGSAPESLARLVLSGAKEVALAQNGVYNTPDSVREKIGDIDLASWSALDEDVEARGAQTDFKLISYSDLVDAIERNDNIITI